MRCTAVLAVAVACSGAFASEPGSPLDCSDWVFVEPGLSCGVWYQNPCPDSDYWCRPALSKATTDNTGRLFRIEDIPLTINCPVWTHGMFRRELRALDGSDETLVAYVEERCGPTHADLLRWRGEFPGVLFFEETGKLVLPQVNPQGCVGASCPVYEGSFWTPTISGFTTTFEVLQTFTPQASLGFRVPYMPEGMPAADSFDTYYGPLTKPLDFTQAQPLACDYPASPPAVGDYLSVADTVPTPAPGQGVYYVTSVTHQGQTRYGRKTTAGVLSGRDPALLPACVSP